MHGVATVSFPYFFVRLVELLSSSPELTLPKDSSLGCMLVRILRRMQRVACVKLRTSTRVVLSSFLVALRPRTARRIVLAQCSDCSALQITHRVLRPNSHKHAIFVDRPYGFTFVGGRAMCHRPHEDSCVIVVIWFDIGLDKSQHRCLWSTASRITL